MYTLIDIDTVAAQVEMRMFRTAAMYDALRAEMALTLDMIGDCVARGDSYLAAELIARAQRLSTATCGLSARQLRAARKVGE
jgi:hypothetical protein